MHDAKLNRSIIAKIRASNLEIIQTWDITSDGTRIDPVCMDGKHLWVGNVSDLGIHRYRIEGGKIVRDGIFRYPKAMSFSQGLHIRLCKPFVSPLAAWTGCMNSTSRKNLPKQYNNPTASGKFPRTACTWKGLISYRDNQCKSGIPREPSWIATSCHLRHEEAGRYWRCLEQTSSRTSSRSSSK